MKNTVNRPRIGGGGWLNATGLSIGVTQEDSEEGCAAVAPWERDLDTLMLCAFRMDILVAVLLSSAREL